MASIGDRVAQAMREAATLREAEERAVAACPEATLRELRREMFAHLGGNLPIVPPAPGSLEEKFQHDTAWPADEEPLTP